MPITHTTHTVNGAALHVAQTGSGPALLLLHGWPEFWLTWEPVMERLADRFHLVAPDLRGFGDSDKPHGLFGSQDAAGDMLALLDALGLDRVGLVGHDIGGGVMQAMARRAPDRLTGLFFFDFMYPGIGPRMATPDRLSEIWYVMFHQMEFAETLVGATREATQAYLSHFLRHWSYRKNAFDDVLDEWVDNFRKPGNLSGGFAYYRAGAETRLAAMKGEARSLPPISVPTCVRWAEHDPIFPLAWADRLGETFPNLDFASLPGVGHFPHRENPDRAAEEIARFFAGRG